MKILGLTMLAGSLMVTGCGRTDPVAPSASDAAATDKVAEGAMPGKAAASPEVPEAAETKASAPALALDPEGLRFVDPQTGRTSLLAFGRSQSETERALTPVLGKGTARGTNSECGAGPVDMLHYGALTLNFQDDVFLGWFLGGREGKSDLGNMAGIGIGATRAEVEDVLAIRMLEGSTLGTEFQSGPKDDVGIGGLFGGPGKDARVDALWAGLTCFFR